MSIKKIFLVKCLGFIIGLTIYNFLYENFINDIILDGFGEIQVYFGNMTHKLPDPN